MEIQKSNRKGKRFVAIFEDGTKTHFGQRGGNTYIDHGDAKKRENYLARHGVNEDWTNPRKASTLSRYISWGPYTQIQANIAFFKNMFRLY